VVVAALVKVNTWTPEVVKEERWAETQAISSAATGLKLGVEI
jgi:hypothetical protein